MLSKEGSLELEAGGENMRMSVGEERKETAAGLGFCWLHPNVPYREISYITAGSKMRLQAEHRLAFLKALISEFLWTWVLQCFQCWFFLLYRSVCCLRYTQTKFLEFLMVHWQNGHLLQGRWRSCKKLGRYFSWANTISCRQWVHVTEAEEIFLRHQSYLHSLLIQRCKC